MRYVSKVDFLWENVRRNEVEIPEFVFDRDEDLEYRPMMDYGLESDHARVYGGAPIVDSPVSTYSMRPVGYQAVNRNLNREEILSGMDGEKRSGSGKEMQKCMCVKHWVT
ncbi:hypothetical protein RIF29_38994 [Crotalaria pallida]|uniref:Uncharacterized protein n=1 Tax=Crotalaria pallida TaxID=3830 RepID=A0AAN9E182_CROPI